MPFSAVPVGGSPTGAGESPAPPIPKTRCGKWRATTGLLLLAAGLCRSQADTEVCGLITTDHWTRAGSPYLVTYDVVVLGSLTIDPGVWVLFQSNNVFQVNGLLTAVGTAADPIMIMKKAPAENPDHLQVDHDFSGGVKE